MVDFFVCARGASDTTFTDEPGQVLQYLRVPVEATDLSPAHSIDFTRWLTGLLTNDATQPTTKHMAIYVHGYNCSTVQALSDHRTVKARLLKAGYAGVMATLSWPNVAKPLAYLNDRFELERTAQLLTGQGLMQLSAQLQQGCQVSFHLIGHSMGTYMIRESISKADDVAKLVQSNWTVNQILLLSADISADSMRAGLPDCDSMARHCMRLTNYQNAYDEVLGISSVKNVGNGPRLGRVGLPEDKPSSFVNVDCSAYYKKTAAALDDGIDRGHSWFLKPAIGADWLYQDMVHVLHGLDRRVSPVRQMLDRDRYVLLPADNGTTTTCFTL